MAADGGADGLWVGSGWGGGWVADERDALDRLFQLWEKFQNKDKSQ